MAGKGEGKTLEILVSPHFAFSSLELSGDKIRPNSDSTPLRLPGNEG